ncbi:MAG: DNA replication/repair protein RecF [Ruminococcaceae bacterium]|nr:DNA replication/repair protein RecF [Oscillospiraceae bacterium]
MRIDRLALNGFRNYDFESLSFSPKINVICGENAQGKTNLLEAVYMLTSGRSYRTRYDAELIGFDSSVAEILADVYAHEREQTVKIKLSRGRSKQIFQNGVKKTGTELSGVFCAVLFSPEDLEIVKGGAGIRRRYIDSAISQLRPSYAAIISEYGRLHEQKTAILRDWREKPSLLDVLDDFSEQICRVGSSVIRYRASFIKKMSEVAESIALDISEGEDNLSLNYKTVSTVADPMATEKQIYYALLDHAESHREAEIASGFCLTGPHKDDMEIIINGNPARAFASQGQTRTAALALKLSERDIYLKETGEEPVLLLDDVLSELDDKRQEFLLNRIEGGQVLITCCQDAKIAEKTGGLVIYVSGGKARHVPSSRK